MGQNHAYNTFIGIICLTLFDDKTLVVLFEYCEEICVQKNSSGKVPVFK